MRAPRSPLQPLGSTAFCGALALLVINDFALKPLFHNALTGKISDFAGLFALALFAAAWCPRRRAACGGAIAVAFVWWKTEHSQAVIDWLNGVMPFAVGRTVDLTDFIALPAIGLGLWAAPRVESWPLPRRAQVALAVIAPLAFTATSTVDHVSRRTTLALPATAVSGDETTLQELFDDQAQGRGLRCQVCEPLGAGRVYTSESGGDIHYLTANYAADTRTVFFEIQGSAQRRGRRDAERFEADIHAALRQRFPDLRMIDAATGYPQFAAFAVEVRVDPLQRSAEEAKRALSQVLEDVVSAHGLETDWDSAVYYAGKRLGPTSEDRELIVRSSTYTHSRFSVAVVRRSDGYEALQRAVATDLDLRLRAAFGDPRVDVVASPWVQ